MSGDWFLNLKISIGDVRFLFHYMKLKFGLISLNKNDYKDSFVSNYDLSKKYKSRRIDRKVYMFWTGNNAITENRARNIELTKNNLGVDLLLVTPDNLGEYILPEYPLHPAYQYLSNVHKSDYLRAYFMHHHGGGYADVKLFENDWNSAFNHLTKK